MRTTLTIAALTLTAALTGCGSDEPATPARPPITEQASSAPVAPATTTPAPATTVTMPNFAGKNAAVAQDTLRKLGFADDRIELGSVDPDDRMVILAQNWTVKTQSVKAGTKVRTDTLVVLSCTKN